MRLLFRNRRSARPIDSISPSCLSSPTRPGSHAFGAYPHQVAFFVSLFLGPLLVATATTQRAQVATVVYAICLAALFGCSALLHRGDWSDFGASVDAAARPFDDLRLHRRYLHAGRLALSLPDDIGRPPC